MSIYIEKNRKTKKLIQDTFLRLLDEKSFESITIGDIAKAAQINRGTFYLHYYDKYNLLEQMEQQLIEDLGKHIDELQARYFDTDNNQADAFQVEQEHLANMLFSFIKMHASMLKIFLSDHGRAGFHIRFKEAFSEKVRINIERNKQFFNQLNVPIDYFLSFITSAFLGLIEQWVQNNLDKSPQEMTELYINIILFIQGKER